MENILETIARETRDRIAREKEETPEEVLYGKIKARQEAEKAGGRPLPDFLAALKQPDMTFICEVKKASPSKGLIAADFPYVDIAREYEQAGAGAISCLTEPFRFLGKDEYLEEISANVGIPVLRKDFTVDRYMILKARAIGASAVLLICSILTDEELLSYRLFAEELGMHALVEAHDEKEVKRAVNSGARIIGVNNRDLRDFSVSMDNSIRLRSLAPSDRVFVSESGIKTADDIRRLYENGVNAVLIGETLMRSSDKAAAIRHLKGI